MNNLNSYRGMLGIGLAIALPLAILLSRLAWDRFGIPATLLGSAVIGAAVGLWLAQERRLRPATGSDQTTRSADGTADLPDSYLERSRQVTLSGVSRGLAWGLITAEHGTAVFGNDRGYAPDLYYGRLSAAAEIALVSDEVQQNQFNIPIIKVKALTNRWENELGQVGWVSLTDTSFTEQYDTETKRLDLTRAEQLDADDEPAVEPTHPLERMLERHRHNLLTGWERLSSLQWLAEKTNHPQQELASSLLHSLAQTTTAQFGHCAEVVWCIDCLSNFGPHPFVVGDDELSYYGCRLCQQSERYFLFEGPFIAILDDRVTTKHFEEDGFLHVNWLRHRQLFDFEAVKIIQATDEDVERFAVQVGNDTDPTRQARYRSMTCTIAADCHLSENTHRILQNTFGRIKNGMTDVIELEKQQEKEEQQQEQQQ